MIPSTSFTSHPRTSSQSDEQHHRKSNSDISTRKLNYLLMKKSIEINYSLGRQASLDVNTLLSNDTFAFDNSLCGSNDEFQPIVNTEQSKPPPVPPRVPRTLNGSNNSTSPSS